MNGLLDFLYPLNVLLIGGRIGDRYVLSDGLLGILISWINVVVVSVNNENIIPIDVVPFVSISLMRIQIDYHNALEGKAGLQVVCSQRDIRIYAKSTSIGT